MADPKYKALQLSGDLSASSKKLYTMLNDYDLKSARTELDLIKDKVSEIAILMESINKLQGHE